MDDAEQLKLAKQVVTEEVERAGGRSYEFCSLEAVHAMMLVPIAIGTCLL